VSDQDMRGVSFIFAWALALMANAALGAYLFALWCERNDKRNEPKAEPPPRFSTRLTDANRPSRLELWNKWLRDCLILSVREDCSGVLVRDTNLFLWGAFIGHKTPLEAMQAGSKCPAFASVCRPYPGRPPS
jgi:hypothetical protein